MSHRTQVITRILDLVGEDLSVEQMGNGWPALATVIVGNERLPVALFVSYVSKSGRGRDGVERRFQNPGGTSVMDVPPGRMPVLMALWDAEKEQTPVLVLADANRRNDGRSTRWSVFLRLSSLELASRDGWASHLSDSDERITYFIPPLLSAAIEDRRQEAVPLADIDRRVADFTRTRDRTESADVAKERTRRFSSQLVRDSTFARRVFDAYGPSCGLCGIDLGLVQGAHIYPASAPGSSDSVRNGLPLCANHHAAFDRHILAIDPMTLQVRFHPRVAEEYALNPDVQAFMDQTYDVLHYLAPGRRPSADMFARRYRFYDVNYAWVPREWLVEFDTP